MPDSSLIISPLPPPEFKYPFLISSRFSQDIPFYVKTIVEPQKPVQTKIHVMRIPKKYETTSPLPDVNLNLVELINNDTNIVEKGK